MNRPKTGTRLYPLGIPRPLGWWCRLPQDETALPFNRVEAIEAGVRCSRSQIAVFTKGTAEIAEQLAVIAVNTAGDARPGSELR